MQYRSIVASRGPVVFPEFTAERIYMRRFNRRNGLPRDLIRWQPTVDQMLEGVDTDGPIYMMVDQAVVKAGATHRRPGLHIDGYWNPVIAGHQGGHTGGRGPTHRGGGGHGGGHMWAGPYNDPEAILLASNVVASRALAGEFTGVIGEGGDCSAVSTAGMEELHLEADRCYAGNVTMLHESLPVPVDVERTVVRLNTPGWTV